MAAALAYRDFMVGNHTDAGQVKWLAGKGIDLIRGDGKLAGPGVIEVARSGARRCSHGRPNFRRMTSENSRPYRPLAQCEDADSPLSESVSVAGRGCLYCW